MSKDGQSILIFDKVTKLVTAIGVLQFTQRLGFDLSNSFPRNAKRLPHFLQRVRCFIT